MLRNFSEISGSAVVSREDELRRAIIDDDVAVVGECLQECADDPDRLNKKNSEGNTALMEAAGWQKPTTAKVLLVLGVDVDAKDDSEAVTSLHKAAHQGTDNAVAISKMLLQYGASVNAADDHGDTPLHAAAFKNTKLTGIFLAAGAYVNSKTSIGSTPLHDFALSYVLRSYLPQKISRARLLVENGADVFAKNDRGETPYDVAASLGPNRLSDYLLKVMNEKQEAERQSLDLGLFGRSNEGSAEEKETPVLGQKRKP